MLRQPFSSRFNPRARVGRDPPQEPPLNARACFNPRARVGRDANKFCINAVTAPFQSTRPRGARRYSTGFYH